MDRKPTLERREFLTGAALIAGAAQLAPGVAQAAAPSTKVVEEQLHGRRAFVVQNSKMRLGVLPGGGFIGEASLVSKDPKKNVNVMRVPHYQTIDPFTYDLARDGAKYSTGIQRRLFSGYMGQFTAFPHFAASSQAEFAQDYGQHGELIMVEWKRQTGADGELVLTADLPITQYTFERRVSMPADETVAYISETAENQMKFDRPATWTQHTNFGPPFTTAGKSFADASAVNSVSGRGATAKLGEWPIVTDDKGQKTDLRAFTGSGGLWLMDRKNPHNYFVLYNPDFKILVGYLFEGEANPWLLDFQENMRNKGVPWDGKTVERGLCFGDSVSGGLKNAVTQGQMLGVPTYSWFDARGKKSRRYAIFMSEAPAKYKGVEKLEVANGAIKLTERGTGKIITVKASKLW